MLIEKTYNVETGETTELPLSAEAISQLVTVQAKIEAEQIAADAKMQAREAVLNKLGLTEDEAKLLLG
jgi:hypothetical protein